MISKDFILANGGATVDNKGNVITLKSGYQVSIQDGAIIDVADFTQEQVEKCIAAAPRGKYAGFWVEDGKVYCDISKRIATKSAALELGKQLNQISVFDWRKQSCVYC